VVNPSANSVTYSTARAAGPAGQSGGNNYAPTITTTIVYPYVLYNNNNTRRRDYNRLRSDYVDLDSVPCPRSKCCDKDKRELSAGCTCHYCTADVFCCR
jgi:hypothetical protein